MGSSWGRFVAVVAVAFGLLAGTSGPSGAVDGGGAATGSLSCADGHSALALDSPAFVFGAAVPGPLKLRGQGTCFDDQFFDGMPLLASIENTRIRCGLDDQGRYDGSFGGLIVRWGTLPVMGFGGMCKVDGSSRHVEFLFTGSTVQGVVAPEGAVAGVIIPFDHYQ